MSRPFRTFLPALLAVLSFTFTACVGTIYDRTYSNKKSYFKAPVENKKEASAESILSQVDASAPQSDAAPGLDGAAPGLPAPGGDIPGLPAADPGATPMPALPPAN
jgi:hypothetical protein